MSRMSHPIEQDELMAYLDGELALDRAAMAAAHLEKCRECQSLAGDLQSVSRKMTAWQVNAPDDLRMSQAISAALEGGKRTKEKPAARGRLGWREALGMPRVPRWVLGGGITVVVLITLVFVSNLVLPVYRYDSAHSEAPATAQMPATPPPSKGTYSAEYGAMRGTVGKLEVPAKAHEAEKEQGGRFGETRYDGSNFYSYTATKPVTKKPEANSVPFNSPMVVRTAGLTLITREFDKARTTMEETLKRHGGYVGQLNVSAPGEGGRTLNATLRIPAGQLDATLTELKKLGRVAGESQSGEEVTQQYVDLEARLANARNSEQRLTDILRNRTGKLSDVLEVETEIERVRGEIEQMEAERKNLAKQVDFATLNTILTEEYESKLQAVPVSTFTRIRNAAVDGYSAVTESLVSVVLFLFSYGPVLVLWGAILFFPARAVWRRWRKRSAV